MTEQTKRIVSIYTEATPNPSNMKFVVNKMLYSRKSIEFKTAEDVKEQSPLATALFGLELEDIGAPVKSIFINNNYVTIAKKDDLEWVEIIPGIKEFIRNYLQEEKPLMNEELIAEMATEASSMNVASGDDDEIVVRIKEILTKYVQPAVEMDGGSIVFRSFDDGIVTLGMQGACAGCPSSTITLKAGIENMMRRSIPEVKEVVAEAIT